MLQLQQLHLPRDPAAVAGQAAVRADDAVARDHQRNRVMPHRAADGLRGHVCKPMPSGDLGGDLAVGHGASVGDRQHDLADLPAEGGGVIPQGRQMIRRAAGEINVQPASGLLKQRPLLPLGLPGQDAAEIPLSVEPESDDGLLVARQRDRAEGGEVFCGVDHVNAPPVCFSACSPSAPGSRRRRRPRGRGWPRCRMGCSGGGIFQTAGGRSRGGGRSSPPSRRRCP